MSKWVIETSTVGSDSWGVIDTAATNVESVNKLVEYIQSYRGTNVMVRRTAVDSLPVVNTLTVTFTMAQADVLHEILGIIESHSDWVELVGGNTIDIAYQAHNEIMKAKAKL